jgi:hypothetical protein
MKKEERRNFIVAITIATVSLIISGIIGMLGGVIYESAYVTIAIYVCLAPIISAVITLLIKDKWLR